MKKDGKKDKTYNNLIEYFYLFGIEPDSINVERFDKEQTYLKQGYINAELLSKFPPNEKSDINIDSRIIKHHCFPNGFTLIVKNVCPLEEYFHFKLDNMIGTDTDNKVLNFCCVLFYEPLAKYVKVKNIKNPRRETKKKKKKNEQNELSIDNIYVPKALCISSFLSFPNEFKFLLGKLITYSKTDKISIPIEKIIENMVYGIPRPPRAIFDIKCKKQTGFFPKQDFEMDFHLPELNQYLPYSFKYQSIFNFNVDDIIDIYKNLLLEVPVLFFCSNKELLTNIFGSFMALMHPFKYQGPHCAILPDMNAGIIEISKTFAFGINHEWINPGNDKKKQTYFQKFNLNIINKKILICDIDHNKIYKYYNSNPVQHIINFNDLGVYSVPEGTDPLLCKSKDINNECFNNWNEYVLPEHYTKKLKKTLNTYIDKNKNMNSKEYNLKVNKEIGEQIFYYYLASIFQTYNDYVYKDKIEVEKICYELLTRELQSINIDNLFNVKGFTSDNSKDTFYAKFFETNIFKDFLKRKYLFKNCDKYDIINFDEEIALKKNKKIFSKKIETVFKDCKSLKFNKNYVVKKTNNFNKDEYKYIEEHPNILIKYYQKYENNSLSYIIFPKFLYDNNFFEKKYETTLYYENEFYFLVDDYKKSIEKLKELKIYSIYNIDSKETYLFDITTFNYPTENENALYLLWINIFCLTLHYCDEKEKQFRYEEMMELLSRITFDKNQIINLLISTLGKYGDDKMMIRFFENLKYFDYSSYTYMTIKFLNEKKLISDLKKMNIANTRLSINYYKDSKAGINIFDIINNNSVKNLKPRTFELNINPSDNTNENPNQVTQEAVIFDDMIVCEKCKKPIEIGDLTIAFKEMNKGYQLKCPKCRKVFAASVNIQFGKTVEKIKIYGTYYLYTLSNDLVKNYGNKMNMDDLRIKYKDFFWNCIWYFRLKGISFDMMLKYKFINYYSVVKDNKTDNLKKRNFNNLQFERQMTNI